MATAAQKQQLMQTLLFPPRTITISLSGYGGEMVMGTVDPATARYWQARDDFEQYAGNWSMEDEFAQVPDQYRFINNGAYYEVNDLAHCSGVEINGGSVLEVQDDDTGHNLLTICMDPAVLGAAGIQQTEIESVEVETSQDRAVFVGQSVETGLFFSAQLLITKAFDPAELVLEYGTYDGTSYVESVTYCGQELDGRDNYDTVTKSTNFELYTSTQWTGGTQVYSEAEGKDSKAQQAIDAAGIGPWHDTADHDPVHVGYYDCRLLSTPAAQQRLRWTGDEWFTQQGQAACLHVSHWRGLNNPVDH